MAVILDTNKYNPTLPNQRLGTGDEQALAHKEYVAEVENAITENSILSPLFKFQTQRGTSVTVKEAVAEVGVTTISRNHMPTPEILEVSDQTITCDQRIASRTNIYDIDLYQSKHDYRAHMAQSQGRAIAGVREEAIAIQVAKSALLKESVYGKLKGYSGGTQLTLTSSQSKDGEVFYTKLLELIHRMEVANNVDHVRDKLCIALPQEEYFLLQTSNKLTNRDWKASDEVSDKGWSFHLQGVPVYRVPKIPQRVISKGGESDPNGFILNTDKNDYSGDFTKLKGLVFNSKVIWGVETEGVEVRKYFDELAYHWFITSTAMFNCQPDRSEYAGALVLE